MARGNTKRGCSGVSRKYISYSSRLWRWSTLIFTDGDCLMLVLLLDLDRISSWSLEDDEDDEARRCRMRVGSTSGILAS